MELFLPKSENMDLGTKEWKRGGMSPFTMASNKPLK